LELISSTFRKCANGFIWLSLLEQDSAEIVVGHPGIGISFDRGLPEGFDVGIHRALSPS
jgi:hypothetical protein